MRSILKLLRRMADEELLSVSEAIDVELERRLEKVDPVPDSARRRAVMRQQSYRHRTGAAAPPVTATGLGKARRNRLAA
jgi:hypothetical protein